MQKPGASPQDPIRMEFTKALKARNYGAPSGLSNPLAIDPGALPLAITFHAFGVRTNPSRVCLGALPDSEHMRK